MNTYRNHWSFLMGRRARTKKYFTFHGTVLYRTSGSRRDRKWG